MRTTLVLPPVAAVCASALVMASAVMMGCSGGQPEATTPPGAPSSAQAAAVDGATTSSSSGGAVPTPSTASPVPSVTASAAPSALPPGPNLAHGEKLFTENFCNGCHGSKAKPGKKNIFSMKWSDDEKKKAEDIIKKGKSPMPAFGDKLSESDIADLIAFVSTK